MEGSRGFGVAVGALVGVAGGLVEVGRAAAVLGAGGLVGDAAAGAVGGAAVGATGATVLAGVGLVGPPQAARIGTTRPAAPERMTHRRVGTTALIGPARGVVAYVDMSP